MTRLANCFLRVASSDRGKKRASRIVMSLLVPFRSVKLAKLLLSGGPTYVSYTGLFEMIVNLNSWDILSLSLSLSQETGDEKHCFCVYTSGFSCRIQKLQNFWGTSRYTPSPKLAHVFSFFSSSDVQRSLFSSNRYAHYPRISKDFERTLRNSRWTPGSFFVTWTNILLGPCITMNDTSFQKRPSVPF